MGVSSFMSKMKPTAAESQVSSQTATPARADSTSVEKDNLTLDDSPVKYLTWRSFILGLCVSMGGFIFGYSTGRCHTKQGGNATLTSIQVRSRVSLPCPTSRSVSLRKLLPVNMPSVTSAMVSLSVWYVTLRDSHMPSYCD